MIMVNFMGLGDKDHRGKGPFSSHHLKSVSLSMWGITPDVNLNHLTEVVWVKFIHCLVSPNPCHLHSVVFGRNRVEVV